MALIVNGNTVPDDVTIKVNGKEVKGIKFNGSLIWGEQTIIPDGWSPVSAIRNVNKPLDLNVKPNINTRVVLTCVLTSGTRVVFGSRVSSSSGFVQLYASGRTCSARFGDSTSYPDPCPFAPTGVQVFDLSNGLYRREVEGQVYQVEWAKATSFPSNSKTLWVGGLNDSTKTNIPIINVIKIEIYEGEKLMNKFLPMTNGQINSLVDVKTGYICKLYDGTSSDFTLV